MRQVKKARIIFFILGVLLTCAVMGALGYFMITERDNKIIELNEQKADAKMFAFARNIPADSEILPGDIAVIDTKLINKSSGGYYALYERNIDDKDPEKGTEWVGEHYIITTNDDGTETTTNIPMVSTDLIGKIVKTDVTVNTPVMDAVLYPDEDIPSESERFVEYNFLEVPSDVYVNDYIDVRIQFPTGEDYLVLVGKKVVKVDENNTIFLKITEEEQLAMASAIIEAYIEEGCRIYARKYISPATQMYDEKVVDYVELYKKAVSEAINAMNIFKAELKMVEEGLASQELGNIRWTSDGKAYATDEAFEALSDQQKAKLLQDIKTDESELNIESIASSMGVRKTIAEAIKYAIDNKDEAKIDYFKNYRVLIDTKLVRTYPVKSDVMKLIETKPNIYQEVVDDFTNQFKERTRKDRIEVLWEDYATALPKSQLQSNGYSNDGVKSKEDILEEIHTLEKERKSSIAEKIGSEEKTQSQLRAAYISRLLGKTSSTEE